MQSNKVGEIVAGATTFAAMSYIAFANPAILEPLHMAPVPVFLWTCIMAGVASIMAGWTTSAPTAIACGMGLNVFVATYGQAHNVPWPNLLLASGIMATLILIGSILPWRKAFIAAIPRPIFAAIKAGVGGLLADVAVKKANELSQAIGFLAMVAFFACGIAIIVGIKLYCAVQMEEHQSRPERRQRLMLLDSSSYVLSIIVMVLISLPLGLAKGVQYEANLLWVWLGPENPLSQITNEHLFRCAPFAIAAFFVMMLDIAGSPAEYYGRGGPGEKADDRLKERAVSRSLRVDSFCNVIAPIAGTTPLTYYAENHVGWEAKGRTGLVAVTVGVGFFLLAFAGLVCVWLGVPIVNFIPAYAVMPALLVVGLLIIADSFVLHPADKSPDRVGAHSVAAGGYDTRTAIGQTVYFVPAAVTVVMATATTFDNAIAAGIVAHGILSLFPLSYLGVRDPVPPQLSLMYFGAVVVLVFSLWK